MLVKVRFIKDHNGYKKGQEWPMMLSYAEKFKEQGIVAIIGGDIDKWFVKPEPEVEEIEDEQIAEQYGVEEPMESGEEEESFFTFLNNKKNK